MNWWRWIMVWAALILAGVGAADPPPRTPYYAVAVMLLCLLVIIGPAKEG